MRKNRDCSKKCFEKPSLTQQQFKYDVDINNIIKRFKNVHGIDYLKSVHGFIGGGQFGDFSDVPDYRTAIERVRQGEHVFMQLPAQLRNEFGNDAASFLDFCSNPSNLPRLRELGLAKPEEARATLAESLESGA